SCMTLPCLSVSIRRGCNGLPGKPSTSKQPSRTHRPMDEARNGLLNRRALSAASVRNKDSTCSRIMVHPLSLALPVCRIDLAVSLLDHKTIYRLDKRGWFRDVLPQFRRVENIGVNSILAGRPPRRMPVGRWWWFWWLLCCCRWRLRRGELSDVAVKLEIDHLAIESAVIAAKVVPLAGDF